MLDPWSERQQHRERWKRVRAEVLAERLQDAADAALDTADSGFRRINRAISWKPERGRSRLLFGILTFAFGAALIALPLLVDLPHIWRHILPAVGPVVIGTMIGLIARGYVSRQRREESVLSRQRGAR